MSTSSTKTVAPASSADFPAEVPRRSANSRPFALNERGLQTNCAAAAAERLVHNCKRLNLLLRPSHRAGRALRPDLPYLARRYPCQVRPAVPCRVRGDHWVHLDEVSSSLFEEIERTCVLLAELLALLTGPRDELMVYRSPIHLGRAAHCKFSTRITPNR